MGWKDLNQKLNELGAKREISYTWCDDRRIGATAKITLNNKEYIASSQCSEKDIFNGKLGRLIALGRAYEIMMRGR